jgi:hypothetical protein
MVRCSEAVTAALWEEGWRTVTNDFVITHTHPTILIPVCGLGQIHCAFCWGLSSLKTWTIQWIKCASTMHLTMTVQSGEERNKPWNCQLRVTVRIELGSFRWEPDVLLISWSERQNLQIATLQSLRLSLRFLRTRNVHLFKEISRCTVPTCVYAGLAGNHLNLQGLLYTAGLSNAAPVIYFPGALIYSAGFNVNQNFKKNIFLNNSMFQYVL